MKDAEPSFKVRGELDGEPFEGTIRAITGSPGEPLDQSFAAVDIDVVLPTNGGKILRVNQQVNVPLNSLRLL